MMREKSYGSKVTKMFSVCAAQISLDRSATALFNHYYVQASKDQEVLLFISYVCRMSTDELYV